MECGRWYAPAVAHRTVARRAEHLDLVKGSRFLAVVTPIRNEEDAVALRDALRGDHPDASHHCLAWRVGESMRFDDDGEPGGTAGRPMLEVLLKRDLDRVAAVVVRTFGGTKLGAGGLARAYTGAVAKALDDAGVREVADALAGVVRAPFAASDEVHRLLDTWAGLRRGTTRYESDGLSIPVRFRAERLQDLHEALAQATRGAAVLEEVRPSTT